ncbi:carboxylesterase/lipase family protein [Microbacterium sp. AG1240]|uniref:carboxylesterase/lipase family protein n=1 Tax=Microbacterium sp. AG1240 TaxID=2183992 RepID=UPI00217DFDCF|nr:carboxylesterase family protein [Microbacterium sp. AG1240]
METTSGTVRGTRRADGSEAFLGIPYAEPPYGDLRFAAPQPRAAWSGVREADSFGATPQRRTLSEITTIPEPSIPGDDVLNLNVFTPAADGGGALPVMVWIHGGGYVAGSPASPWYDGRSFARDGVVTVVPSYRLGFDGFGWLPDAPLNRGVLDLILALEWVQQNISRFGGDPERVTIAGQSAGGGAVMTLLTMPRAQALFRSAISVSGVPSDVPLEGARQTALRMAAELGVPATAAGFASVDEAALIAAQGWGEDMTDNPGSRGILRAMAKMDGTLPFGPIVDGDLHPTDVDTALAEGRGADKPLLVGATLEEFGSFFASNVEMFHDVEAAEALDLLGADAHTAERYAQALSDLPTAILAGRWVTDVMFRERIVRWVESRRSAPTWVYDFTWRSGTSGAAEHCLDVPFAFDVLDAPEVARVAGPDAPQSLADAVHAAYVAFITHGDPGWERTSSTEVNVEVFSGGEEPADGYLSARVLARRAPRPTPHSPAAESAASTDTAQKA